MEDKYGYCEHCNQPIQLDLSDVGVGKVWHGYCCGWNQTPIPLSLSEVKMTAPNN